VKKILFISKIVLPVLLTVLLLQVVQVTDSQAAMQQGGFYHTVQYGDTLFSIGRIYGVNPYTIAEVNGLANPNYIYAGQVLYIPSGGGCGGRDCGCGRTGCGYQPPPSSRYYAPVYSGGYGYDYTGYYYYDNYPKYRRYSYTCGYHFNCY
jgi:LysM repeat protein